MRKLKLDVETLGIESFSTEKGGEHTRGTVAGHLVPADSYDCGYTERECGTGGSGGSGSGLTYGQTCGWTCEYDQCGPNYTIFSCAATC